MQEKGVGLSRTTALQRATADIVLFSDEDIVYENGYAEKVFYNKFFDHHKSVRMVFPRRMDDENTGIHQPLRLCPDCYYRTGACA